MKYVIWGAGHRGKVLAQILGADLIAAYIDCNPEKVGLDYCGKPVISYDEYKKWYKDYVIIISIVYQERIEKILRRDGLFYFGIEECPPEYMGYGWRSVSKYFSSADLDVPEGACIYGATLFSVLVYEHLMEKGLVEISLIPHTEMTADMIEKFKLHFPFIKLSTLSTARPSVFIVTVLKNVSSLLKSNIPQRNIYDWTKHIPGYYNPRIADMHNVHAGERCFIVATGPSLTYSDLEVLHENHEFCISMNTIFKCFGHTKWRPDQYAVVDADGLLQWENEIRTMDVPQKFIADCQMFFDYSSLDDDCYIYHSIYAKPYYDGNYFSDNFSQKVYNCGTITEICIQLAAYQGFSEIYLLGVDFSYQSDRSFHFAVSDGEEVRRFDMDDVKEYVHRYTLKNFITVKAYADSHNIKIYNATRGGNLEVFKRVDFDSLF